MIPEDHLEDDVHGTDLFAPRMTGQINSILDI